MAQMHDSSSSEGVIPSTPKKKKRKRKSLYLSNKDLKCPSMGNVEMRSRCCHLWAG